MPPGCDLEPDLARRKYGWDRKKFTSAWLRTGSFCGASAPRRAGSVTH
jgi:hypothetical protein